MGVVHLECVGKGVREGGERSFYFSYNLCNWWRCFTILVTYVIKFE